MFLSPRCLQCNGASGPLVPARGTRGAQRGQGGPRPGCPCGTGWELFPNAFPSGTGQLSPIYMSLHFPGGYPHRRRWASTPVTGHSHLWLHQELWLIQRPRRRRRHSPGPAQSVPSVPGPPRSDAGCGCLSTELWPPCSAAPSPGRVPPPVVTGLPRRCPRKSLSQQRRCWAQRLRYGHGHSRARACPDTLLGPPGGQARAATGREMHLLPQFPSSCRLGEAGLPCSGPQPMLTTVRPTVSPPAWELCSRGSQPSQDPSVHLLWTPSPPSPSRILSFPRTAALAGPPEFPGSLALSRPPAPQNLQTFQEPQPSQDAQTSQDPHLHINQLLRNYFYT